jgi:hypothetical protein
MSMRVEIRGSPTGLRSGPATIRRQFYPLLAKIIRPGRNDHCSGIGMRRNDRCCISDSQSDAGLGSES